MNAPFRSINISLFLFLCISCQGGMNNSASGNDKVAICKSIHYLQRNGFLEDPADKNEIDLQLWDKMKYSNNGVMDWNKLLRDRQGHYINTLYGYVKDGEDYLVFFSDESAFSCVRVSEDMSEVQLTEANCKPSDKTVRLKKNTNICR